MFRTLMTKMIAAMEKATGVEAPYAYHLRDVAPARLWRFALIKTVEGPRQVTPAAVYHAAGLASAMVEDCGPCVQIHVNFALKDGVAPEVLRALIARRFDAVPAEVASAFKFGEAVSASTAADERRDDIRKRWGDKGVPSSHSRLRWRASIRRSNAASALRIPASASSSATRRLRR